MATKKQQTEREEARNELRKLLKPKVTVYTILRHCSASGMSRVIDLVIPVKVSHHEYPMKADGSGRDYDAKPRVVSDGMGVRSIGYLAAKAMGDTWDRGRQGIKIGGCGMDMGFALVYNLGYNLWPKGTKKPHSTRNGEPDRDGGYALNHRWL